MIRNIFNIINLSIHSCLRNMSRIIFSNAADHFRTGSYQAPLMQYAATVVEIVL